MRLDGDQYEGVAEEIRSSLKVRRSEFIAIAFPIDGEEKFHAVLDELKKEMFDAVHHCWAFRLIAGETVVDRSSDAGEPSGTAGRPILQAIEDADLFDSAVVVVRYFGGVKLGTGGLARAYRDAARQVLREARIRRTILYDHIECEPGFESMNLVYRLVEPPDVVLEEEHFEPEPRLVLQVRRSITERIVRSLVESRVRVKD
ncbi:MAG: YigZ family protein [Thermoanaerobaculia bacterium]|nr:YigZ family protein [Thermoanaerobaculia bacterium]